MIDDLRALLRIYRDKLVLILLILGMPWAWAFFWVPWWVNLICLGMVPVAALLLVFRVLPQPPEPRRETDEPAVSDVNIRKMRKMSSGIHNLLSRWSQVSSVSRTNIEQVGAHVDDVIAYSESAVVEVGRKFVSVTRKTRNQVEYALSLLARTGEGGDTESGAGPSLPDLVSAYEALLKEMSASLSVLAESAQQLEKRHETERESLRHIDTLLDQLSAHDSQIGMMALNSSVAEGNKGSGLVSVSDHIRTLSLESKALTRDIRRTLEEVKGEASKTWSAVRGAAQQARDAAQMAGTEGGRLSAGLRQSSKEVRDTLSHIGALGGEIQGDINDIIVALQFQDITQQKLQRLKDPMLTDLTNSLRQIFDETRVLSSKLEVSGMVEGEKPPVPVPFRVSRSGDSGDGATDQLDFAPAAPAAAPAAGDKDGQRRKGDEAVEIF
jgi:ABC-type transporter Mla subunit MlaD